MLPSLVAQEIREGLRQFLVTGFEPSNASFRGLVSTFLATPGNLDKGPYLSIGLPFRQSGGGRDFFSGFQTEHPPFVHQEIAWQRLSPVPAARAMPVSTIVATGTGSGKTECFLYPLLEHCLREHEAGRNKGVKALVIYPMNALGSDQARRFAEAVQDNDRLRGRIRVGLYIGKGKGGAQGADAMGAHQVITDKKELRRAPPDILLTNYKMLDYLLIRPRDQVLWRENGPETLRYLVVDELHTFDGAQGTDLALLIRRLKARLETPAGHLVCVGTSATLGDTAQAEGLLAYAREVFGERFAADAVVGEDRMTMAAFLGGALIEHQLAPADDLLHVLDPRSYASSAEAIAGWHRLFFPDDAPAAPDDPAWRASLGQKLKGQLQFNNLLRLLEGTLRPVDELVHELPRFLPAPAKDHPALILDGLLALVAWARDPGKPSLPFVQLRLQLWLREQRRMLVRLTRDNAERVLVSADDLKADKGRIHLPLVQCSDCLSSAWLTRLPAGTQVIDRGLQTIYDAFFNRREDLAFLYPAEDLASPWLRGESVRVCGACGQVQAARETCQGCGSEDLVAIFRPHTARQVRRGESVRVQSEHLCAVCGSADSLLLFGARSTTLSSVAIQHLWGSRANDHRKLIAFSDSVQDAAHRAGFFAARTYANNVRSALAQALSGMQTPRVSWPDFLDRLPRFWLEDASNPKRMSPERFVVELIGPNMTALKDYEDLCQTGASSDWLLDAITKRLKWEALAEFGYLARRGRSLERVGCAALGVAPELVARALPDITMRLSEEVGLRDLDPASVRWLVWGLLFHLKHQGAIADPVLSTYIQDGGRTWLLGKLPFLPNMGPHSRRPLFIALARHHPEFDTIESTNRRTWYQQWVGKVLGSRPATENAIADDNPAPTYSASRALVLVPAQIEPAVYGILTEALAKAGVLRRFQWRDGPIFGLAPEALFLEGRVARLVTEDGASQLAVPESLAETLMGMPAIDITVPGVYARRDETRHWLAFLYRTAEIRRVIAAEHTGLLDRMEVLEPLEARFKSDAGEPWNENLLSATPTLEMGVDIGSLSAVLLCSVPPAQANYLQRVGRAGRRDGNALTVTVATGRPHDLYFYARPEEMMAGPVDPPGVFLNASAVLFRQLTAFCLDAWVATGIDESAIPATLGPVLDAVEKYEPQRFPYNFIDFVKARAQPLFVGFCGLLADSLTDRTREALDAFLFGGEETDGLRVRLVKRLQAVADERKAFAGRAKVLKGEIDKLKRAPQDDATAARLEEARREREALVQIVRGTNAKDLLNFLTDEGLIPNYAFPEEGVTLRSVLWRRRREPRPGESPYESWVIEYERGAAPALTELAPTSHFFASGRRVQVDQIDLTLSPIETWRLCSHCSHAENLDQGDTHVACPRCGSVHWADVGQRRNLIRLRHVLANTEDPKSRIDDGSDDRDTEFYSRQLLPDFVRNDVQFAYRIASDALPFGFEFVRKVVFRDINFGKYAANGDATFVGGREAVRRGFRICRHCGKVQTNGKRRERSEDGDERQQTHAYDCPQKDRNDPNAIVDCLYLYREFQSEALRILLPVTKTETDARAVPSLSAAIWLGLKLRFGGKVDHLRMVPYEEPDRTIPTANGAAPTGAIRRYLMIYDTVPGGTGYLHELLRDANRLLEVLRLARDHMRACVCSQSTDREQDGCYRCLFAYRLGSGINLTSRTLAAEILSEILDAWDKLEPVETLSDILINPTFESALEARFIEAFKRRSGTDPSVRIQQDVVRGKAGYRLRVGDHEYTIEPQIALGPTDGVPLYSKPDFLIRPARSSLQCLPVAVFTDGFEYHKDCITEDTLKRLAIVQSGRFWTWSLTWQDIEDALTSSDGAMHPLPSSASTQFDANAHKIAAALGAEGLLTKLVKAPFDQLIEWLRQPQEDLWAGAVFARLLSWARPGLDTPETAATKCWLLEQAPSPMREQVEATGPALSGLVALGEPGKAPRLEWLLPSAALGPPVQPQMLAALMVVDPLASGDDKSLREAWRKLLAAGNLLQFLPCAAAVTAAGAASGVYEQTGWSRLKPSEEPVAMPGSPEWQIAIDETISEASEGLGQLMAAGVTVPAVGYELQSDSGAIVAEAELAWIDARVAVLRADQADHRDTLHGAGWKVVLIGDRWVDQVLEALKE